MLGDVQAWHVNPLSNYVFFLLLAYGNKKNIKKKKQPEKIVTWYEYFISNKRQNRQKDLQRMMFY